MLSQEWWMQLAHKVTEAAVHHGLGLFVFSVVAYAIGFFTHRRHQAKYGMRTVARICWIEDGKLLFKEVRTGTALFMAGSEDVAGTLVKAAKKARPGQMLWKGHWQSDAVAERAIRRLYEGVSVEFAAGVVARANDRENASRGTYAVAAFRRDNSISVILCRQHDLDQMSAQIVGEGPELLECSVLRDSIPLKTPYVGWTDLYM